MKNQKKSTKINVFTVPVLISESFEKIIKNHKKSRKIDSKIHTEVYRVFNRFGIDFFIDFPPTWDPKSLKIATET